MNDYFDSAALTLHALSCFYMTGVIWVIQLIHYPSFAWIDRMAFSKFHLEHTKALGVIAGPVMCIELGTALWLAKSSNALFSINASLVALLWFVTFFVSVPCHSKLASGFDKKVWLRLVRTNWIRTALWGLRTIALTGWLIYQNHVPS